jgi:AcrR family transcriptional regulator
MDVPSSTDLARRPRRQRSDGLRSRAAILREAARLATVEGIEGLSIGDLAEAVGMSKSGLFAHFRSKEELQLATIETADTIFQAEVVDPALTIGPGLGRLRALCEAFLLHLENGVFPGGCFFASVAAEIDTHPGPGPDRGPARTRGSSPSSSTRTCCSRMRSSWRPATPRRSGAPGMRSTAASPPPHLLRLNPVTGPQGQPTRNAGPPGTRPSLLDGGRRGPGKDARKPSIEAAHGSGGPMR